MSADDEIRVYLRSLLEHSEECQTPCCALCAALEGVLDTVRSRIFSGPVFPDVMIGARAPGGDDAGAPALNSRLGAQRKRRAPEPFAGR